MSSLAHCALLISGLYLRPIWGETKMLVILVKCWIFSCLLRWSYLCSFILLTCLFYIFIKFFYTSAFLYIYFYTSVFYTSALSRFSLQKQSNRFITPTCNFSRRQALVSWWGRWEYLVVPHILPVVEGSLSSVRRVMMALSTYTIHGECSLVKMERE